MASEDTVAPGRAPILGGSIGNTSARTGETPDQFIGGVTPTQGPIAYPLESLRMTLEDGTVIRASEGGLVTMTRRAEGGELVPGTTDWMVGRHELHLVIEDIRMVSVQPPRQGLDEFLKTHAPLAAAKASPPIAPAPLDIPARRYSTAVEFAAEHRERLEQRPLTPLTEEELHKAREAFRYQGHPPGRPWTEDKDHLEEVDLMATASDGRGMSWTIELPAAPPEIHEAAIPAWPHIEARRIFGVRQAHRSDCYWEGVQGATSCDCPAMSWSEE